MVGKGVVLLYPMLVTKGRIQAPTNGAQNPSPKCGSYWIKTQF